MKPTDVLIFFDLKA